MNHSILLLMKGHLSKKIRGVSAGRIILRGTNT